MLSAPVVALPVPPPAFARFPVLPPAPGSEPSLGSAAARGPGLVTAGQGSRVPGPQPQSQAGTVKPMSGMSDRTRQLGYTDYLRRPGLPQLAGAALPGVAGIVFMTVAGGIIGHRQANAGRMIRTSAAARFLP
ncbi:hypothetical protein DVS77_32225 [Mycolicibacterium moriokaense]|nr:hypothetical protein DVS77_32225 [Mycolicibacterium moriokaense]